MATPKGWGTHGWWRESEVTSKRGTREREKERGGDEPGDLGFLRRHSGELWKWWDQTRGGGVKFLNTWNGIYPIKTTPFYIIVRLWWGLQSQNDVVLSLGLCFGPFGLAYKSFRLLNLFFSFSWNLVFSLFFFLNPKSNPKPILIFVLAINFLIYEFYNFLSLSFIVSIDY